MVDALHRAHSLLTPGGIVIDLHPTPEPAHLEVATETRFVRVADRLDDGSVNGPRRRHLAADSAVETCISMGLFTRQAATHFSFRTYADSVQELLAYLDAKWKQLHFAADDLARAHDTLERIGTAVVVTEQVSASRLRRQATIAGR
jgi:hypothetical protein